MNYGRIQRESLGKHCRSCMNEMYQIHLERSDCIYIAYPAKCSACGRMKNIVMKLNWRGRIKAFFAR